MKKKLQSHNCNSRTYTGCTYHLYNRIYLFNYYVYIMHGGSVVVVGVVSHGKGTIGRRRRWRIYRSPDPSWYLQYIKTLHTHDAGPR